MPCIPETFLGVITDGGLNPEISKAVGYPQLFEVNFLFFEEV